jgi:excisionase family DNA binding protein
MRRSSVMPIQRADEGLSVKDAALALGVHEQTIRKWIRKGALPATRFGPNGWLIRIDPEDLKELRQRS